MAEEGEVGNPGLVSMMHERRVAGDEEGDPRYTKFLIGAKRRWHEDEDPSLSKLVGNAMCIFPRLTGSEIS